MENNNSSTTASVPCKAGCGFYGNEAFNNMCSKCFKENTVKKENVELPNVRKHLRTPSPEPRETSNVSTPSISSPSDTCDSVGTNSSIQNNKGKCFCCRKKIPLAKQTANKCRCGLVFCDTHKYPDKHDCDIDFAKMDKEILAKNNPKLHKHPKGGRSFQRIDSL